MVLIKVGQKFSEITFEGCHSKQLVKENELLYEQILSKFVTLESIPRGFELILFDVTVKNKNWLFIVFYKLPSQNEKYFLHHLSKTLVQLTCPYDKTNLIRDFNLTVRNKSLKKFMSTFDL